jgi:hypothetical protein
MKTRGAAGGVVSLTTGSSTLESRWPAGAAPKENARLDATLATGTGPLTDPGSPA